MANRPLAPNHILVFDALKKARRPMTAYELIDALRPAGISAPPTVYRALNRLISEGLAHRIESMNAFVACAHPHGHRGVAVFVICDACGATSEFTDEMIGTRLAERAAESRFAFDRAVVELRGTCAKCAAAASAPSEEGV